MPANGPGLRQDNIKATKAVLHGDPVVEDGFPGVAFKNTQLTAFIDPLTTAARTIAVDEGFTIVLGGMVDVRASLFPGGVAAALVGTPVYINGADNTLSLSGSPATGVNEQQTVTVTGTPTGGSFTLTFSGQTTAAISYASSGASTTAAVVQSALEALSNIDPGDVVVTGNAGGPFTVTFQGQYADTNVPQMTHTDSLTGGSSPAVAIATATAGAGGIYRFGRVSSVIATPATVRINTNARDTF